MKKNKKIGVVVILITTVILVVMYSSSQNFVSIPDVENTPDIILTNADYVERISSNSPIIGIIDAPVTIFAFNDYQCQSCKYWYENEYPEVSERLINTNKANMVFLDAPPLGDDSILISQATYCANDQGKYPEYQEILFSNQQEIDSWAKSEQLKSFAIDLNLNLEKFENCLDSRTYETDIQSNIDYTTSLGVEKIPLFKIVNFEGRDFLLKGSIPSSLFEETVDKFQN